MANPYIDIKTITDNKRVTTNERIELNIILTNIQKIFISCINDRYSNVNWCLLERFKDNYSEYKRDKVLITDYLKATGFTFSLSKLNEPVNVNYKNYLE